MPEKTTLPRTFMFNGQRLELPDKIMSNESLPLKSWAKTDS